VVLASRQNLVARAVERNIRTPEIYLLNSTIISEWSTCHCLGYLGITQGLPSAAADNKIYFGEINWEIWKSTPKMEAAGSPETLVPT